MEEGKRESKKIMEERKKNIYRKKEDEEEEGKDQNGNQNSKIRKKRVKWNGKKN